jgi:RNA polymerase sigma-70 factor (ECF subfamily)
MIGRAEDAEDALQEVWTDIYRGLARLETAAAFVPWIYRIARSRALRHWRRKRVPCVPLVEDEVPQCGAEPVFGSDEAQEMIAALDRISAEHREALLLHYIEGMTAEQISQVTGCPAGTVRSRLHYAKRSLRREMEQRCNDEPI